MLLKKTFYIFIIPVIYILSEWSTATKDYQFCNRINEWIFYKKNLKSEIYFHDKTGLSTENILKHDSVIIFLKGTALKKYFYEYNHTGDIVKIRYELKKDYRTSKTGIDISGQFFYDENNTIRTCIDTLNYGTYQSIATTSYHEGKIFSVEYKGMDGYAPTKHVLSYSPDGYCTALEAYNYINGKTVLCQKNTFRYTANGEILSATYESFMDKNNDSKYIYEYNEKGYLSKSVNYFRNWQNRWAKLSEIVREYEYDEQDRVCGFSEYRINDKGIKLLTGKTIHKFDHNGNQIQKEEYGWNVILNRLEKKNKYIRYFNADNQLVCEYFAKKTKLKDDWDFYAYTLYYPKIKSPDMYI